MSNKSLGRPVLYALVFLGLLLSYLILRPFLVAMTWAVMFAILFRRMQVALTPKMGPGGAAGITTLVIGILIVAPVVLLTAVLAREAPGVADHLRQASGGTPPQIQKLWDGAKARSPFPMPDDPSDFISKGTQRALTFLTSHASGFAADFFGVLGNLVAMLFALFFILRDGDAMSRQLRERLPFTDEENGRLMAEARDLVIASIGAGLVVAATQGAMGGAAFWLVGISNPVFWGAVTAFCSLLPVVGATIVWVPAAIGLLLSGETGRGILLLVIGVFGISMADNVLRPLLLAGKTSVSGFVIFFGLLGGAAAFGFIGLVIGPIVLVITGRVLENLHRPDLER